jgi:hypothetical protein
MGFLKELFEKKLKTSTSMCSRDMYDAADVSRSAQSEWSLPALHSPKGSSDGKG